MGPYDDDFEEEFADDPDADPAGVDLAAAGGLGADEGGEDDEADGAGDWADDEDDPADLDPERSMEPWRPQAGAAEDPFAEKPEERRRALAPLLERGGRHLTWSSLRFLRGTGEEKLDLVLSLPDPLRAVQALAPEEFVLLVKEIGLTDSAELLSLASPRQLQATVDLDAWLGGELDAAAFSEWLLTADEAGRRTTARFVAAQDDGLLSLYLAKSLRIVMPEDDGAPGEVPDDAEVFASPDGAFQLVANPDDPNLPAIRKLIAAVWRQSPTRGRALLLGVRWELPTQLEDEVLQLRNARLDEIGFLDRDEALALHGYRDPHKWRQQLRDRHRGTAPAEPETLAAYLPADVPLRLGLALRAVQGGSFLAEAMALLPDDELARLRLGLVRLGYAIQSARAERPSAVDELSRWSRHGLMTASMGLEFLCDGELDYAALLLTQVSLLQLFTAGHSLVLAVHQQARRIRQQLGGDAALERLEPGDCRFVRGLARAFPLLASEDAVRPVESLAECAAATARLRAVAAVVRMAETLADGDLPATAPLPLRALVGTAIAWQIVGGEVQLKPLDRPTFQRFLAVAFDGRPGERAVRLELRHALTRALLARPDLADADVAALAQFLDLTLDRLADELGGLDPHSAVDLRYVGEGMRVAQEA